MGILNTTPDSFSDGGQWGTIDRAVRHAEQTSHDEADPSLSEAGQRRVAELTRQLADADVVAGIDAIYSTVLKRATETAQPLADRLDLPINIYDGSTFPTPGTELETVVAPVLEDGWLNEFP